MSGSAPMCTYAIIVLTVFCSFIGFRDPAFREKFLFSVPEILAGKQFFRLITSAFLHADWNHLTMNMITLFFFGGMIEVFLGSGQFLLIYFSAIIGGDLLSLWLHRHHEYRAYGASGGVCGMMFSYIALFPNGTINFHLVVPVPAWLYAILFLVGSFFALKRQHDNVGHDAHLGGALIGMFTTTALHFDMVQYNWPWLLLILVVALPIFIYLFKNPLFLPMSAFFSGWPGKREKSKPMPHHQREALDMDAVLEKISRSGMDSLTAEERTLLNHVSEKYQSRSQSEKPKSDLII
jgi:membrane associated rhomboid family serine protease